MTSKLWEVMNDLEMVTSKVVSAREIIDTAAEAIQRNEYDKAETLAMAAYEFLGYYLQEFDAKFKLAWQETVVKQKKEEEDAWNAVNKEKEYYEPSMPPWGHSDLEYLSQYSGSTVSSVQYTEEELNAMCDKAASDDEKQKCREYNLREAEYYDKRARLDAQHSKYYYDVGRNKTYEQMITEGWEMTDDGFWIKEK